MRTSRIAGLIAVGAISLPLLSGPASATDARLRSTPPIGRQLAELKGSDTIADNGFGVSVAISGTTIAVCAPGHSKDAGQEYMFTNTASGWKQAAELKGSDTVATDYFGESVAISANCAVVGAPVHAKSAGRAYLFTKTASGWRQIAELKGSDTVAFDYLGPVSISGGTAIAGAGGHARNAGRAYVFQA